MFGILHVLHRFSVSYNESEIMHYGEGVGDLSTSVHRAGPIWAPSRGEHWAGGCLLRCSRKEMGPTWNPDQSTCLDTSHPT